MLPVLQTLHNLVLVLCTDSMSAMYQHDLEMLSKEVSPENRWDSAMRTCNENQTCGLEVYSATC